MKLGYKLLAIPFMAWMFVSCADDSIVHVEPEGEETMISATLSVNGVETKAQDYVAPVGADEKKISNYVIAVFNPAKTDVVGLACNEINPVSEGFTVNVAAKGYDSEQQVVLTIANLSKKNFEACKGYTTYKQFQDLVVEQTESFLSAGLIKIAEQEVLLKKGKINVFDVKLDQLVARVDVSFTFSDASAGASFQIESFQVEDLNLRSKVILPTGQTMAYAQNELSGASSLSWAGNDKIKTLTDFSFYTYEKVTANKPIKIRMTGLLKCDESDKGERKTFQYALDPVINQECKTVGIVHANSYAVKGIIDITNKSVTFTVKPEPWVVKDVSAEIVRVNYLFVSEHLIYMPNINQYTFSYASNLGVKYSLKSVKYTGYDINGNKVPGDYGTSAAQYPSITLKDGKVNVSMKKTPINYVPTYIQLKISTSGDELSDDVEIIHYPTPYVEAFQNLPDNGSDSWGGVPEKIPGGRWKSDLTNYNVFSITSIAAGDFQIGDPTIIGNIKAHNGITSSTDGTDYAGNCPAVSDVRITGRDEKSNNLVSPKFIIASQRGITNVISQDGAEMRCYMYTEWYDMDGDGKADKLLDNWRVPTLSELKYIATLQGDGNSAVKKLLTGDYYWAARPGYQVRVTTAGVSSGYNSNATQFVRCVHDIY